MAQENLENLLKLLLTNKIDFVLIGGFASVVHGSTYVTQDLDICMALTPETIENLRTALAKFHPVHRMNPDFRPSFAERPAAGEDVRNLYLQTDLGTLDILTEVSAAGDFQQLKARASRITIYGHECAVISIDDLIRAKESIGRKKDLLVVEELKEIRNLQKKRQ